MLRILGVIINLSIVAYLGFQGTSCLGTKQITGLNIEQDPLVLSFVAAVSLFIALKN